MSDFVQTMKDWRRMCNAQDDGSERDVCATCPFGRISEGCMAIYEGDMDYDKLEHVVTAWAAEHPMPVYPTWKEWLEEQRVVVHFDSVNDKGTKVKWELTNKSNCPIPADIAEKLGIEPKEV